MDLYFSSKDILTIYIFGNFDRSAICHFIKIFVNFAFLALFLFDDMKYFLKPLSNTLMKIDIDWFSWRRKFSILDHNHNSANWNKVMFSINKFLCHVDLLGNLLYFFIDRIQCQTTLIFFLHSGIFHYYVLMHCSTIRNIPRSWFIWIRILINEVWI